MLSHSFLEFLVDRLGVRAVVGLLEAEDVEGALAARPGRTVEALKADWLGRLRAVHGSLGGTGEGATAGGGAGPGS